MLATTEFKNHPKVLLAKFFKVCIIVSVRRRYSELKKKIRYEKKGNFKMLRLKNNFMELELVATIGNNALLKRLNGSSYIVCNGLNIHNDFNCDWNFSYGYFENYDQAYNCFIDKIVKPFMEYREV